MKTSALILGLSLTLSACSGTKHLEPAIPDDLVRFAPSKTWPIEEPGFATQDQLHPTLPARPPGQKPSPPPGLQPTPADLPPCSEQVFSRNPLILLMILWRQGVRPSAYIICKLLEHGRGVPKAFRMAACRASGVGRRVIAVPRTW